MPRRPWFTCPVWRTAPAATDGHLPTRGLTRLYPVNDLDAAVTKLVTAEKWKPTDSGYLIVDWEGPILPADRVKRMQEQSRVTSERHRRHEANDHSMCERCWYIRKHGRDAVTDGVTAGVSDAPPYRSVPIRPEGEEREER